MKGIAQLGFNNERVAHIAFSLDSTYQNNYSLWGNKGLIKVKRAYAIPSDMKPEIQLLRNENLQESIESIDAPAADHFVLLFQDFCNTVTQSNPKKISSIYEKILSQAKVLEAIRISSSEKRRVFVEEIR